MPLDVKNKQIAFICPYPFNTAPGQRFRFEMYLDQLASNGYTYHLFPFLDEYTNRILFSRGRVLSKVLGVLLGFIKRFFLLFRLYKYAYIYIFREATPIGPPIFEWIIAKVLRKKIIYDYDDAIWLPFKSDTNRLTNHLKFTQKVGSICKWSYKISCGNHYLAAYAQKHNSSVVFIPTIVDTDNIHNKVKTFDHDHITVGWTGSHSTNKYLTIVLTVLKKLQLKYNISIVIISNQDPELEDLEYHYTKWNSKTEVDDLFKIDIGIMPLVDDEWAKGKCGFKAIQYQALGMPAVVSPVGVNTEVVKNGTTGYTPATLEEWYTSLEKLILDPSTCQKMGKEGRKHIVDKYSKKSTLKDFLNLFS